MFLLFYCFVSFAGISVQSAQSEKRPKKQEDEEDTFFAKKIKPTHTAAAHPPVTSQAKKMAIPKLKVKSRK
jgi:hypothetical protein